MGDIALTEDQFAVETELAIQELPRDDIESPTVQRQSPSWSGDKHANGQELIKCDSGTRHGSCRKQNLLSEPIDERRRERRKHRR